MLGASTHTRKGASVINARGNAAWTLAIVPALLMIVSGIAGLAVGGPSAAAGWWLIVVGGLLAIGLWLRRPERAR